MIGIIILIDILLPPAVWKSIQCIFGILDLIPRITGYSAWLRILGRENRRNGEIDIHISKILIEKFHAIIISLYTCGNLRIIPFVRFHRTVCHEVHLHILESCTVEQTGSLLHHSFHCRMRWIDCISAVQFLRLSVGIEIDIFVFIFRCGIYRPFRIACPVGERSPVDTTDLSVRLTLFYKWFQLFLIHTVPTGVQTDIDSLIRVYKMIILQILLEIIGDFHRFLISQIEL